MVSVTKEGYYSNQRNCNLYNELKNAGYNTSFFTKPVHSSSTAIGGGTVVANPFIEHAAKKDCFSSVVDGMSYVPNFFEMRKR